MLLEIRRTMASKLNMLTWETSRKKGKASLKPATCSLNAAGAKRSQKRQDAEHSHQTRILMQQALVHLGPNAPILLLSYTFSWWIQETILSSSCRDDENIKLLAQQIIDGIAPRPWRKSHSMEGSIEASKHLVPAGNTRLECNPMPSNAYVASAALNLPNQ